MLAIEHPSHGAKEIEAELRAPSALSQVLRYHFAAPPNSVVPAEEKFRVELCLTSRHSSARGCFCDQWSTHRFERVGTLFMVPPDLNLLIKSDEDDSMTSIVCELNSGLMLELFDKLPELTDQYLSASLDIRNARLRSLLLWLAEEARHPGFASEMLFGSIATQIAIELFRRGTAITERGPRGGLSSWQLRRIDERLREIREAPTLPELATLCLISVRQLTRGFRASRACSVGAYVANHQIEHAKGLLATDDSVASIANALGFSSSSNFSFAFRRAVGMTPGEFRRTLVRHRLG